MKNILAIFALQLLDTRVSLPGINPYKVYDRERNWV